MDFNSNPNVYETQRFGGNAQDINSLSPTNQILIGIFILFIGVASFIYLFLSHQTLNEKKKTFVETSAVVVDYLETTRNDEDGFPETLYALVAEYEVDNKKYQVTSKEYNSNPINKGESIKIIYDPNDPRIAEILSDSYPFALIVGGGIFSIAGLFGIIKGMKEFVKKE